MWWHRITSLRRRWTLLALLSTLGGAMASHGEAQEITCEAVDTYGQPRDCTLSEKLGACAYNVWESWKQCVDTDGDGYQDVSWWMEQYCNMWSAFDLIACGLIVPWDYILPPPPM